LIAGEKYFHNISSDLIKLPFSDIKVISLTKLKKSIITAIEENKKSSITEKIIKKILNQEINLQIKNWNEKYDKKHNEWLNFK
jgi:hypothetical protein